MKAIAYTSEATVDVDAELRQELDEVSIKHNQAAGITGYLNFKKGRFFQYLEGPENALDDLLASIYKDKRHRILRKIDLGPIAARRFPVWQSINEQYPKGVDIRIQDLIEDVSDSVGGDELAEQQCRNLLREMLDRQSRLQRNSGKSATPYQAEETADVQLPPFIVVLGASAGGLLPLQTIFKSVKPDIDVVFIVIQHLSPQSETVMDMILQRDTLMPVRAAADDTELLPGHVFVIPPGDNLQITDNRFVLSKQERQSNAVQFPIDICLKSIALEYGDRAIAVILSGSGSDGSKGAKVLNEAGGIVIAQSMETCEFEGMPRASIETGHVHQVLAPVEIAEFINALSHDYIHDPLVHLPLQRSEYVGSVVALLENDDIDFSQYKSETLFRRIERRRVLAKISTSNEYLRLLESSESERHELRDDILITVTSFFRDEEAWLKLSEVITPLLDTKLKSGDTFRVWVNACATGEEAYSVAILLTELFEKNYSHLKFKIYATDIERKALDHASVGHYSTRSLEEMSLARRERFFTKTHDGYVVTRELRKNVIFAPHNFVKIAPFTRMHLVTCRNVLIYMQPRLQQLALKMLHFAMNVDGILFLGPSESLGQMHSEFHPLQREWNLYRKLRNLRLPLHLTQERFKEAAQERSPELEPILLEDEARNNGLIGISLDALGQHTGNTNVLVDSTRAIRMLISDPQGTLQMQRGVPTLDITAMLPETLRASMTFAISRAFKEQIVVTHRHLECISTHQKTRYVDLQVVPYVPKNEEEVQYALVVIGDCAPAKNAGTSTDIQGNDPTSDQLQIELEETKKALRAAIMEVESSNNEQRSINEQLSATNEELQSTNEELQSVNEELYTVNFEYQTKIHELSDLNQDLDNLLDSANLGVIFLDTDLCIRRYTDVATQTVNLLPSDIGRPFVDLTHNLNYKDLVADLRRVLSMGKTIVREIPRSNVEVLQVSIHPYRADDGIAHGVLIMFKDGKKMSSTEVTEESDHSSEPVS